MIEHIAELSSNTFIFFRGGAVSLLCGFQFLKVLLLKALALPSG